MAYEGSDLSRGIRGGSGVGVTSRTSEKSRITIRLSMAQRPSRRDH
jgi:hypothetical protein